MGTLGEGVDVTLEWDLLPGEEGRHGELGELAHELQHVLNYFEGNIPVDPGERGGIRIIGGAQLGGGKPISALEPAALRTENIVRQALGRPLREKSNDLPILNFQPKYSELLGGPNLRQEYAQPGSRPTTRNTR